MVKPIPAFLAFIFIVSFNTNVLFAQSNTVNPPAAYNSISVTGLGGLAMFSSDNNNMKGSFWGGELGYSLNMQNNTADWVKMLNVKSLDFAFSYRNFDNVYLTSRPSSVGFLGDAFSAITLLNMQIFETGKTDLIFTPGFGVTYATKTYRTGYNPLIGSHINLAAQVGFKIETPVSTSTKLILGLNLYHYSNSAFKLPNEGVNTINATLGFAHDIDVAGETRHPITFDFDNRSSFEFGIGYGHRGLVQSTRRIISAADSIKQEYATSHLNNIGMYAGYNYRVNPLFSLKAATDVVYYSTPYNRAQYFTTEQEYGTSADKFSVGASLGFDIWLNRLVFELNYGYYLHLNYGDTPIYTYWTFGAKYYLTKWMALEAKEYMHETESHYANFGLLFHVY